MNNLKPKYEIGQYIKAYIGNDVPVEGKIKGVDNRRAPYFYTIAVYGEKKVRETGVWESEILGLTTPNKYSNQWIAPKAELECPVVQSLGKKYDSAKLDYTLVTRELMDAVSRAMMYGAKKYNRDNYKLFTSADIVRFQAALLRHAVAWASGEEFDPESGLSHLDHVGSTLNILLWLKANKGDNNAA